MMETLVGYSRILAIIGDIVQVQVPEEASNKSIAPRLEDLAIIEALDGSRSLAQVISIKRDVVALQVFRGTRGISTESTVRFPKRRIFSTATRAISLSASRVKKAWCAGQA